MSRLLSAEYRVVENFHLDHLQDQVSHWLREGWECQGSIAVSARSGYGSDKYFQAMVKIRYVSEGDGS